MHGRKLWCVCLLALCLLPAAALAAPASEVWVDGVEVSAPGAAMPEGVQYDAATVTLTDAALTRTHNGSFHDAVIHANGDLTILLVGDNTIEASGGQYFLDGIYVEGSVTFDGTGSLSVRADGTASEQYGLSLGYPGSNRDTEARILGGDIALTGKKAGLYADNSHSGTPLTKRLVVEGGSLTLAGGSWASALAPEFDEDAFVIAASYDASGSPAAQYAPFDPGQCYYAYLKIQELTYDEYGFGPGLSYQPAALADDGVYEIGNAGQLFWFSQQTAATGGKALNARLVKDVVIPSGRVFSPIGGSQGASSYSGVFDGQGHSVTGMTISSSYALSYTGFVGNLGLDGVIRNLRLKEVSIEDASASYAFNVGAICSENNGVIENCAVESGNVVANTYAGGICGENNGIIRLCANASSVSASSNTAGGICGLNTGMVENCLNTGAVSAGWYAGGICGQNAQAGSVNSCLNLGSFTAVLPGYAFTAGGLVGYQQALPANCYYLAAAQGNDGARTQAQLLSGEVTWLLNGGQPAGAWGQTVDGAAMPQLGGKAVYRGYASCDGSIAYGNASLPQDVPAHQYGYRQEADGHLLVCAVCGATGTLEPHTMNWTADATGHSGVCTVCGYAIAHEAHIYGGDGACETCGYEQPALPVTGDSARPGAWLALMLAAGALAAAAHQRRRRA